MDVVRLRPQDCALPASYSSSHASRLYRFTPDPPKYATHGIQILAHSQRYVLDYVGATLPRKDHGDREVYCRTMLTCLLLGVRSLNCKKLHKHGMRHFPIMRFHHVTRR